MVRLVFASKLSLEVPGFQALGAKPLRGLALVSQISEPRQPSGRSRGPQPSLAPKARLGLSGCQSEF